MAYPGQQLYNPITGEHITFLVTAEETDGEYVKFDCRVEPGKTALKPHVHAHQEERFQVLSGTLECRVGRKKVTLRAGDSIVLPKRVVHQWKNAGDDEAHFLVEVSPARNIERTLEAITGMAQEGKLSKGVMPKNPFRLAQFGKLSETYLPIIPIWMQQVGVSMGALAGRMAGYDASFAAYAGEAEEAAAYEAAA